MVTEPKAKWGKICSEDGKGSKARISAKKKRIKEDGKIIQEEREPTLA